MNQLYNFSQKKLRLLLGVCMVLSVVPRMLGQTLLTESFNSPNSTALTSANWTQFAAATPVILTSTGNLAYPGTIGNGIGNKASLGKEGQDVYRTFSSPALTLSASVPAVYASAVVNVTSAQQSILGAGDYFLSLGVINTVSAKVYIRSNGTSGFSFGLQKGSTGAVEYESVVRPYNTNINIVLKYEWVNGSNNDVLRLYVNPSLAAEPSTADVSYTTTGALFTATDPTSLAAVQLSQGTNTISPVLDIDNINVGTTWASVTSPAYDYGDLPVTYDTSKDNVFIPAVHAPLSGLYMRPNAPDLELGPASVASGADNNGSNGDGADEDAIDPSANPIRKGVPYSLSISVNNPAATARTLYGWIDFNGDGRFQLGEAQTVSVPATAGSSNQTLTWTSTQTATLNSTTKVYMRLRLSTVSLIDVINAATVGYDYMDERSIGNGALSTTSFVDAATYSTGEVEDYQIPVSTSFDYGDVPAVYENDKDGNALPALHLPLSGLTIGTLIDAESAASSVAAGADNNGNNGDGADEDGISTIADIQKGVAYSVNVPVNNPSATARYLYGWIDFNNDGKFQLGELADAVITVPATSGTSMQTLTWAATKTANITSVASKLYMRLRLSSTSLADFTTTAGGAGGDTLDERSIGNGATSTTIATNLPTVATGEVEDYQIPVSTSFDYGDVPASYENDKDGNALPALHLPLSGLTIGTLIDAESAASSVAAGADNNGNNGDGADEDGITTVQNITKGLPYSITVPVNNPSATARYLYGWIDFNNDGKFQLGEFADAVITVPATAGASTQTLSWSATKTANITSGSGKIYMRMRLSSTSLFDFTTLASGGDVLDERSIGNGSTSATVATNLPVVATGEVEDYQVTINNTFEYGDAPSSFENDKDGNPLPAVHALLPGFTIGKLIDTETAPASVSGSPVANENNTAGDNAVGIADEDGLSILNSVSRGVAYSITVPVNVPSTLTGNTYLYGWLDLNGDGKYQVGEGTAATNSVTGENYLTLNWAAGLTSSIPAGTSKIYLRLRYSNVSLLDFTGAAGGTTIDEKSIGNGATSNISAVNNPNLAYGEVEDYQLPVDAYDFGDAPVGYDTNNASSVQAARHISSSDYKIGSASDYEPAAQSVASGADNNGTNGDGLDEDGLSGVLPVIVKGTSFNFSVPVNTAVASNIMAWIDFNNNGKFELSEAAYTTSTGTTQGYQTTAVGTSTVTFWFRGAQTTVIPNTAANLYARIRLTATAGADAAATTGIDERSIADGANTGIYTTPSFGEVEDYRFAVGTDVYDFGDAPVSYEMDKDGTANPANFKPARNNPNDALFLGNSYDRESAPASVAAGADNNSPNGDGTDEDGIGNAQLFIKQAVANTYTVAVNNNSGSSATLYGWIDFNNNGRFEAGEIQTATVANGATSAALTFAATAAQVNAIPANANKVYMRLRLIQPDPGVIIQDYNAAPASTNYLVVDERAIADGLVSGAYGSVSNGEVEDYQLTVIKDFGDAPVSYENGSSANAASHTNSITPDLTLGATVDYELSPASVTSPNDNNGTNGDGADEDAVATAQTITSGTPFTINIPVNTTVAGTKYLYAWIDFNGDGVFNGNEVATANAAVSVGTTSNFTLTWNTTTAQPSVLAAGKTYVRFRVSDAALAANTNNGDLTLVDTRSYGMSTTSGEVEDYQFLVTDRYDYGDAPQSYDMNKDGLVNPTNYLPARQAMSPLLRLGDKVDVESAAQNVAAGANNNGTNGDGNDEDGTTAMPIVRGTTYYSKVSVMNNTGTTKTLYGWIDLNNNGRFETGTELSTVSVPSSASKQIVALSWTAAETNTIPAAVSNVYMRLRLSAGTLTDFTTAGSNNNTVVDERAIGDGLAGTAASTPYGAAAQIGEIEDYLLPVTTNYDYGDLPDTYDNNVSNALVPGRQAINSLLHIGSNTADDEVAKLVSSDASGDDNNGIDDEDGVALTPIFTGGGAGYTSRVRVSNFTGTGKTLYGWIDFDNDGIFQQDEEAVSTSIATGTDNGWATLTWTNAQSVISGTVPATGLSMRLRLSEGTLTNAGAASTVAERALGDGLSTGLYATAPSNGEIEDHKIPVTNLVDYGDVPLVYETNFISVSIPARHLPDGNLYLGNTVDTESSPQSVAAGANNNAPNGDGNDEDGISTLPTLSTGAGYPVWVNVTNNQATAATLHGWIDLDGNGAFTSNEYASATVAANSGSQQVLLNWPVIAYSGTTSNAYMRLRLTNAILSDNAATTGVDERSIGDGLNTGAYGSYPINGEVEDYFVPVASVPVVPQSCDLSTPLGLVNPIQAVWHTSLIKLASGDWTIFGNGAQPNGSSDQVTPNLITPAYGFNYAGTALMATMASNQYFILTTAGLYTWGPSQNIFNKGTSALGQVPLPTGVAPGNVQMIDGGDESLSLALLTKTGEVWMRTSIIGHNVQGDGNQTVDDWTRVMLNATTPLSGIKDVRTAGNFAFATDGTHFYTWGNGVYLGNNTSFSDKSYAKKMSDPAGITTPLKQIDISSNASASYYVLDGAGKVFVLGNNNNGHLGLGHSTNQTAWSIISQINEEPGAAGNQTDITKPIGKVRWITANNQDMYDDASFGLITEEDKAYMAAITVYSEGDKTGVQGATNRAIPTAVTAGNGATMLSGKVHLLETGGHISVIAMKGSDRYGYAGHTAQGSDGCGSCTASPREFKLQGPPSIGPICGNSAFDYGDLDDNYNLGDKASHEIKYAQTSNPLKLGNVASDSDDGPQFTVTGSGNDARGDDNDGDTDAIGNAINDEDAFFNSGTSVYTVPAKTAGSSYTLNVPLTNTTGSTAYLYGFVDWNFNGSFEPNEAVVQSVPSSATAQTVALTWADPGSFFGCTNGVTQRSFIRLRLTTSNLADIASTAVDERSHLAAADGEVEDYYVDWTPNCTIQGCYKPGATGGTVLDTKHGITALGRAGTTNNDWPMARKGAWTALESKEKGFVVNRVDATADLSNIINPIEGMMVYDKQAQCLKVYTTKVGDPAPAAWHCMNTPACPD